MCQNTGKASGSFRFTRLRCGGTVGLVFDPMRGPFRMPPKANSARIASLLAMALSAVAAFSRDANAYYCVWSQISGGPRYSYCTPSSPHEPSYGPTVDYPGAGYGGFPRGYGGFPGEYGSSWYSWGSLWSGWPGASPGNSPYGFGLPGYTPMGWGNPWQAPLVTPRQTSPWQSFWWAGAYPIGPTIAPFGTRPLGSLPANGGAW